MSRSDVRWCADELEPLTGVCEELAKAAGNVVRLIPCKKGNTCQLCIVTEGGEFLRHLPRPTERAAANVAAKFLRSIADKLEKAGTDKKVSRW